jgi:hypothetical protein
MGQAERALKKRRKQAAREPGIVRSAKDLADLANYLDDIHKKTEKIRELGRKLDYPFVERARWTEFGTRFPPTRIFRRVAFWPVYEYRAQIPARGASGPWSEATALRRFRLIADTGRLHPEHPHDDVEVVAAVHAGLTALLERLETRNKHRSSS